MSLNIQDEAFVKFNSKKKMYIIVYTQIVTTVFSVLWTYCITHCCWTRSVGRVFRGYVYDVGE